MKLSIIINNLNDHEECNKTILSIFETAGAYLPEIVLIDDASDEPFRLAPEILANINWKNCINLCRLLNRVGCGRSRHLAAEMASGDFLLIIDSHMRFLTGWYEEAAKRIAYNRNTIYCARCLGLSEGHMDPTQPNGEYTGATLNLFGPDKNNPKETQVFEGVWKDHPVDNCEIPCMMGACYFIPKELFFRLGGLKSLKEWGSDEPYLSLKAWLAGAEIRLLKTVGIGHKFRDKSPYVVQCHNLFYNKMRSIMTCTSPEESAYLLSRMPHTIHKQNAMGVLAADRAEIQEEARYNKSIFVHDLRWFCEKFKIPYPGYN